MKYNPRVSSSRCKNMKACFTAPSSVHRVLMRALPYPPTSEKSTTFVLCRSARTTRSKLSRDREGKVVQVYKKKWVIHVEWITREKANGSTVNVSIHPSKVVISKLYHDKDRKSLLERKAKGRIAAD